MKKIIVFFILLNTFFLPVLAEETEDVNIIQQQAEIVGADSLDENLPEETKEFFTKKGITPTDNGWINSFDISDIFKEMFSLFVKRAKAPLVTGGVVLAVILLSGALNSAQSGMSASTANFAVTAVSAAVIITPLLSVINSAVGVMQSVASFMLAFKPVFAVVVAANGQTATSVSMSSLLLAASQFVELVANHFVIPLMCGYLSISIATGVSPLLSRSSLALTIKRISFWIMSLVTTVFLGVLSVQTAVNASADTIATKTLKFIIGSSVPVAGTVLSEALTTVTSSIGMLKTTVAIYGVVVCCVIFLPILADLLLWRFMLNITGFTAEILSVNTVAELLHSVDTAISVLCGIILLTCAMFIISLAVVVSVGKSI